MGFMLRIYCIILFFFLTKMRIRTSLKKLDIVRYKHVASTLPVQVCYTFTSGSCTVSESTS